MAPCRRPLMCPKWLGELCKKTRMNRASKNYPNRLDGLQHDGLCSKLRWQSHQGEPKRRASSPRSFRERATLINTKPVHHVVIPKGALCQPSLNPTKEPQLGTACRAAQQAQEPCRSHPDLLNLTTARPSGLVS